jgi:multiple antibiotic resistance protein
MRPLDYFLTSLVTLLLVVEPFGLAPIFIGATASMPAAEQRGVASRAATIAFGILAGAALFGEPLLRALGITLAAFRIAGGLLLFSIASQMVLGVRVAREARAAQIALDAHPDDPAAFPLAIPLMAGPGAIAATLLLSGRAQGAPLLLALLVAAIAAVAAVCLFVCLMAPRIERALGASGGVVLAKLLGVLLAALAVQYVIDGVRAALA